jgi:hypothetical protein
MKKLALVLGLVLALGGAVQADVYVEDLNFADTANHPFGDAGWTAVRADGTSLTWTTDFANGRTFITRGTDVEGSHRAWGNNVQNWYVTDAPSFASISQVRWLDRGTGVNYRLGLEVGGAWYLSDTVSTSTGGGFDPGDGAHPGITITGFDDFLEWTGAPADDASTWSLTFGPDTLPAGSITRIGLMNITGAARFDYLEVTGATGTDAVPEPATLALVGLGVLGLVIRRR